MNPLLLAAFGFADAEEHEGAGYTLRLTLRTGEKVEMSTFNWSGEGVLTGELRPNRNWFAVLVSEIIAVEVEW